MSHQVTHISPIKLEHVDLGHEIILNYLIDFDITVSRPRLMGW